MSPRFVLGRENVPCVAEVVNRSLKADVQTLNIDSCLSPQHFLIPTFLRQKLSKT